MEGVVRSIGKMKRMLCGGSRGKRMFLEEGMRGYVNEKLSKGGLKSCF